MVGVGMTKARSVRLWMRAEHPGDHEIEILPLENANDRITVATTIPLDNKTDNTHSVLYPDDFPGKPPLRALTGYAYRVTNRNDRMLVGEGRFETAPEHADQTPEEFSIAVMSCHQPFDTNGALSERNMRMLRVVPRVLEEHKVKFILLCGDQIYSDVPENFSLLNPHYACTKIVPGKNNILEWSQEEVRKAYQQRYRIFWSMEEIKYFYANYPCYPILDDHEIMDDWGSRKDHSTDKFRNLFFGAWQAYVDYQGSVIYENRDESPHSLHYDFTYGNVGVFVMDVRSERVAGTSNQLYGDEQFNDFEEFLDQNREKRVLLIVISVPLIHLPSWIVDLGASLFGNDVDFPDHWSYKKINRRETGF